MTELVKLRAPRVAVWVAVLLGLVVTTLAVGSAQGGFASATHTDVERSPGSGAIDGAATAYQSADRGSHPTPQPPTTPTPVGTTTTPNTTTTTTAPAPSTSTTTTTTTTTSTTTTSTTSTTTSTTTTTTVPDDVGSLTIEFDFDPRHVNAFYGPAHELSEINKRAFLDAAAYWESVIAGYTDGVDRTITVRVGGVSGGLGGSPHYTDGRNLNAIARAGSSFDGPRHLISSVTGGTVWVRLNAPSSAVGPTEYLDGSPIFTTDEFKNTSQRVSRLTARHELGHILMNSNVMRASGNRARLFDTDDDSKYVGPEGLAAYRAEVNPAANFVPFNGSDYSHFPHSAGVLLSSGATNLTLSKTTLGILRDLGFVTSANE